MRALVTRLAAMCLLVAGATQAGATEPPVTAVAIAPDGRTVVCGSQAGLVLRGWPKLETVRKLGTGLAQIHDIEFSPDGRLLLVAGGSPGESGTAELYSWPDGKRLKRFGGHQDVIYAVAWREDSAGWATASLDRSVLIFDKSTGRSVRRIEGHSRGVKAVGFLADGKTLLSSGIDQSVRVWWSETGKPRRAFANHTRPVHDLAIRPAAAGGLPMAVTVSEDRTVRLWQPTIGRMVRFARLKKAVPLAVCWTPKGDHIVTVASDGRLRLIDPDTVAVLLTKPACTGWAYSVAVHPSENAAIVGGTNGEVRRIDLSVKSE